MQFVQSSPLLRKQKAADTLAKPMRIARRSSTSTSAPLGQFLMHASSSHSVHAAKSAAMIGVALSLIGGIAPDDIERIMVGGSGPLDMIAVAEMNEPIDVAAFVEKESRGRAVEEKVGDATIYVTGLLRRRHSISTSRSGSPVSSKRAMSDSVAKLWPSSVRLPRPAIAR